MAKKIIAPAAGTTIQNCHFEVYPNTIDTDALQAITALARAAEENAAAIREIARALQPAPTIGGSIINLGDAE